MSLKTKIAILGGGVAGIMLARKLAERGLFEIDLIEKESRLGGLHHSVEIDGLHYDIGTFVFREKHPIFKLFPNILSLYVKVDNNPLSITPSGSLDAYPLTISRLHSR